jgi:hypothetical protein
MKATVYAVLTAALMTACSGSPPTTPTPPPTGGGTPPQNAVPSIDTITAQGKRTRQPARFADLGEAIDVSATVRDSETSLDELVYQWSATAGTFTGSGRNVTWTAPGAATTPGTVTLTLKVIENYGNPGQPKIFSHEVTGTQTIALHDSVKEVGDMARRFLTEFSKPQTNQDWQDIMRDFKASVCAQPSLVDDEKTEVIRHYTNYTMHSFEVRAASVNLHFGGACAFRNRPGDACAIVPVFWDSTDRRNGARGSVSGLDHIGAAYSTTDARWWLCSSDLEAVSSFGHAFYSQ